MNNLLQILIIFLVAAVNALVVVIAVRLIFKIRTDKKEITKQVRNEINKDIPLIIHSELKKTEINKEAKINNRETEEKKEKPEEKKKESKFLKYTSKGYILPEDDNEKKQHIWR